ncbi:hypothetical protein B0H15DRAFT_955341 [Mycena belliarum]|uniref:Uncharacterized protein n=1 Tax=Mycena belliarum TaxID=1033014 RepID=A0AAD6XKR3_9AGAR|nr:hypothetical protein B0H15DRAFT_955341 [Mycena belliae]
MHPKPPALTLLPDRILVVVGSLRKRQPVTPPSPDNQAEVDVADGSGSAEQTGNVVEAQDLNVKFEPSCALKRGSGNFDQCRQRRPVVQREFPRRDEGHVELGDQLYTGFTVALKHQRRQRFHADTGRVPHPHTLDMVQLQFLEAIHVD